MRTMHSEYMEFAKFHTHSKYNLAVSGITAYPLTDLPFDKNDLLAPGQSYWGHKPLLEEISKRYGVDPKNIVHSFGTSMANYLAMIAILEPGDEVLLEHPVYELILSALEFVGATVKRFHRQPENGYAIDTAEIKKLISPRTKLILVTNLHNPSGVYLSEDALREIGEIAKSVKAYVLVDEVYLDAAFSLKPRTSFLLGDQFIVTSSLTKVYGLSALRCGWIFANEKLAHAIWRMVDLMYVVPSHPMERLSVTAFKNLDAAYNRSKSILETNRKLLNQFLDSCTALEVKKPEFGTTIFPKLNGKSVEKLHQLLRDKY
ncbi:MAG TPA: aminotransferase class I/II-fold pyridoxal phosphate-dependent enzyme, partial [Bacteroidota bacterium]|nr:aminotransferase class I/II-fold pyridoxal phosphate-dependent enzyme [Bacteroidota bacterium]